MKPLINKPSILVEELNKDNHAVLLQADENLMSDKSVVIYLINSCPKYAHTVYAFASDEIKQDVEILDMALTRICQCETFNILPKIIQNDKKWMIKAISFTPYIFNFLSEELRTDLDFNIGCSKVVKNFSKSKIDSHIINNEKFIWEVALNSEREIFYSSIVCKLEDAALKEKFFRLYELADNNTFLSVVRKEKLEDALSSKKSDSKKIKI